jgi:MFS family permease
MVCPGLCPNVAGVDGVYAQQNWAPDDNIGLCPNVPGVDGVTHNRTGLLMMTFALASSLGGLLGGKMGDHFATRFSNSGRIVLSQISSASAIPLAALLLLGLPDNSSGSLHGLVMFIMGLSISWNGPATNKQVYFHLLFVSFVSALVLH